jgi:hypothetical protein
MNKFILLAILAFSMNAFSINAIAQPVITDGSKIPTPGFSAPVAMATPGSGIGTAGANQTWDFSSLSFTSLGTMTVIVPSASPMGASFPTANYAYTFAGTTSFFKVATNLMECQAYSISTPGSGNDFTPNPTTTLVFPFNYLGTANDTWQKSGSAPKSVALTYDGYGTLITPSKTYTNIVRIKYDYGNGGVDYQWYALDPLISIMVYDHNSNALYYTGAVVAIVAEHSTPSIAVSIYPNPFTRAAILKVTSEVLFKNAKLTIYNALGKEIKSLAVSASEISINRDGLGGGTYVYTLANNGEIIASGKLIIQ